MAPPNLAAVVEPDLNVREGIALETQRGLIPSKGQLKAEKKSARAKAFTSAVDNFYGIREKESILDARKVQSESIQRRDEQSQLRLEKDIALADATIKVQNAKLAKEKLAAVEAGKVADRQKEISEAFAGTDNQAKLNILTNSKYAADIVADPERFMLMAGQLSLNPANTELLKKNFYDPLNREANQKAQLKELDAANKQIAQSLSLYEKSPGLAHVSPEELSRSIIVDGPDLELPDGRLFSTTTSAKDPALETQKAIGVTRALQRSQNNKNKLMSELPGKDPSSFVPLEEQAKEARAERVAQAELKQKVQAGIQQELRQLQTVSNAIPGRILGQAGQSLSKQELSENTQKAKVLQSVSAKLEEGEITPQQAQNIIARTFAGDQKEESVDSNHPALNNVPPEAAAQFKRVWNDNAKNVQNKFPSFGAFVRQALGGS